MFDRIYDYVDWVGISTIIILIVTGLISVYIYTSRAVWVI
jgi:hypothetical protein